MRATCEDRRHIGDRLVDRRDLLERRIEWRRLTDQGRENVRVTFRQCKACERRELAALDGVQTMQAALI